HTAICDSRGGRARPFIVNVPCSECPVLFAPKGGNSECGSKTSHQRSGDALTRTTHTVLPASIFLCSLTSVAKPAEVLMVGAGRFFDRGEKGSSTEGNRMTRLLATATIVDGLLAGASVDQSVEQLPARHRIGVAAYQRYSQASHMANGRFWLIPLGIGGPVLRAVAAIRTWSLGLPSRRAVPVYVAGALGAAHALSTIKAAGINLAIAPWQPPERRIVDEGTLSHVFRRFERWQALRASLQLLTFAAGVWALAANSDAND